MVVFAPRVARDAAARGVIPDFRRRILNEIIQPGDNHGFRAGMETALDIFRHPRETGSAARAQPAAERIGMESPTRCREAHEIEADIVCPVAEMFR